MNQKHLKNHQFMESENKKQRRKQKRIEDSEGYESFEGDCSG